MMNPQSNGNKNPRKLVIIFGYSDGETSIDHIIRNDPNDLPQLLYKQLEHPTESKKPSRLQRFSIRLGFKPGQKSPVDELVTKPYRFLLDNYEPGDNIIIIVDSNGHFEPQLYAAEILARHLHYGTRPGDLLHIQSKGESSAPGGQIPIHCIIVRLRDTAEGISVFSNQLKSRFPPGTEDIVCWMSSNQRGCSCCTTFDSDGSIISRQICFFDNTIREVDGFIHSTKDVLYYIPDEIPGWDEQDPTWTKKLNTPLSGAPGVLPLELMEPEGPEGMYLHELRKYQSWPTRVVWKSSRR